MPKDWELELRQLKETQAELTRIAKDLVGPPMVEATRDATLLVQRGARQLAHVDTGRWRASITPEVRVQGSDVVGVVGSNLKVAPFIHEDTRPHWPPIAAILAWVHRKGIGGTPQGGGRIKRASATTEAGIAFLIARRISQRGTKGDKAITTALDQAQGQIVSIFARAVARITRS